MTGARTLPAASAELFLMRLARSECDLFNPLEQLYGSRPDYAAFREELLKSLISLQKARPAALRSLDLKRDLEPDWFLRPNMAGYVFYVDRFNQTLKGVVEKLDYLTEIGATYAHFMPCLKPRPGDSDGGYSVMDYGAINPALGSMDDLEAVAAEMRSRGISLCVDLVLNHTAKEHEWAEKARKGDRKYQYYYWMFDDATLPERYSETLVEVFPNHAPGNFTHYPAFGKWVWTTFNEHQWDLNWANPWVFLEVVKLMMNLANRGVEVVRLDAVAFMWKRMGTRCQNEPEVHEILQALRAASRIVAPALIHKEEAIVAPKDLIPYLGTGKHAGREGNLAYHNSLMVQFWSALATGQTRLMTHVMRSHFPQRFENATWGTYLRCHDDIGWAVTDEDAAAMAFNGFAHRNYLADFYAGAFPGSFARGGYFQANAETGDKRSVGSCASLCGLEVALAAGDAGATEQALHRILLGHALIASFGGVPLIYMGDEIGLLNDHSYQDNPDLAQDSRWMHRPEMDWARAERRHDAATIEGRLFAGLQHVLARRAATGHIHAANPTEVLDFGVDGIFAFARRSAVGALVCLFNFTDRWLTLAPEALRAAGVTDWHDQLADAPVDLSHGHLALPPQGRVWIT